MHVMTKNVHYWIIETSTVSKYKLITNDKNRIMKISQLRLNPGFRLSNRLSVTCVPNLVVLSLKMGDWGIKRETSNGSWCMGIKGEMSDMVCVTFTWYIYIYIYIYIWVVYSLCFFCCLFITVTWWYVWCFEWASGNQEEVQACLVTLWLFIISCYSLYKTTLGLLCSWFENNPHFHKYSMDFHV